MPEHLVGFHQVGGIQTPIHSTDRRYISATESGNRERHEREYRIVNCSFRPNFSILEKTPFFDAIDQPEIKALLQSGVFITTEKNVPSVGNGEYALLMSYAPREKYSGRGGILLYKDEGEWKPVTVTVDTGSGLQQYILDVKGTGTPAGILQRNEEKQTYDDSTIGGMMEGEAKYEYDVLRVIESQHPLFHTGIIPFAIYHGKDDRGYEQVIRAIPTTLRPSFRENTAFEQLRKLDHAQIAFKLGKELGRYLGFDPPRIPGNLQTENAYVVNEEQEVVATDFADITVLHENINPMEAMEIVMDIIADSTYEDPRSLITAMAGVISGIRETRPEIQLFEEDISALGTSKEFTDYLFSRYLAQEVLKLRREYRLPMDFQFVLSHIHSLYRNFYQKNPKFGFYDIVERYVKAERRLFEYVGENGKNADTGISETLRHMDKLQRVMRKANARKITDNNYKQWEAGVLPLPYYRKSS